MFQTLSVDDPLLGWLPKALVILPIYQFKFHLNSSTKKSPNLIREPDTALARVLPCKYTCTSRHGRLTLEKNLLLPTFFLHQAVGGTMFPHRLPLDDWLEGAQRMMAKHHHLSVDSDLRCNVKVRIDPYSSHMMFMIISDGKNGPIKRENSHIWRGWVKIGENR